MDATIRELLPEDLETLRELNREVFITDAQYLDDLDIGWPDSEYGNRYYPKVVRGDDAAGFLAEINGKPVGYVAVCVRKRHDRTKTYVEIENMGVYAEYRSQGIGKKLLHKAEEWAKEQGVDRLMVGAASENTRAVKFYKEFGFADELVTLTKDI